MQTLHHHKLKRAPWLPQGRNSNQCFKESFFFLLQTDSCLIFSQKLTSPFIFCLFVIFRRKILISLLNNMQSAYSREDNDDRRIMRRLQAYLQIIECKKNYQTYFRHALTSFSLGDAHSFKISLYLYVSFTNMQFILRCRNLCVVLTFPLILVFFFFEEQKISWF